MFARRISFALIKNMWMSRNFVHVSLPTRRNQLKYVNTVMEDKSAGMFLIYHNYNETTPPEFVFNITCRSVRLSFLIAFVTAGERFCRRIGGEKGPSTPSFIFCSEKAAMSTGFHSLFRGEFLLKL